MKVDKNKNNNDNGLKKAKFWEANVTCVKECGVAPSTIDVIIQPLAKLKIDTMMKEYSDSEWLGYLLGKDNNIVDIFIPEQQTSMVSVGNIECEEYNKMDIIGVIHSHHNMANSFSSTDDDYINSNHNISICVSNGEMMNTMVRWKSPCGALIERKGIISINLDVDFDSEAFLTSVKGKIKEFAPINMYGYGYMENKKWVKGNDGISRWVPIDDDDDNNLWPDWQTDDGWNAGGENEEISDLVDAFEKSKLLNDGGDGGGGVVPYDYKVHKNNIEMPII